jgi:hypothetical protein
MKAIQVMFEKRQDLDRDIEERIVPYIGEDVMKKSIQYCYAALLRSIVRKVAQVPAATPCHLPLQLLYLLT